VNLINSHDARYLLAVQARTFDLLRETATTEDFQQLRLQEIEGDTTEPGSIPRTLEVCISNTTMSH
jgi:DNA replicative helicase MCM subunit Mcm2 (Cdc46/Mcm family)